VNAALAVVLVVATQTPAPSDPLEGAPPLLDDVADPAGDPVGDAPPPPDAAPPETATETAPTTTDPTTAPTTTAPTPPTTTLDPRELRVRLVYSPGPWAHVCPPLDELRDRIQQHLGYDPFGEPAERVVLLLLDTVDGSEGELPDRARVELLDQDLRSLGTRSVSSSEGCGELVATAALQVSIAVDPAGASRPPRPLEVPVDPAAPTGTTTPEEPALRPVPPAAPPQEPAPVVIERVGLPPGFFGVDGHVAALLTPQAFMFGGSAYAGFRWEWLSSRLELRIDFPGDDNRTTSVPILLALVPCAHIPLISTGPDERLEVSACATLTGGVIPVVGVYNGLGVYAGTGGRVGLDWRFDDASTVRGFLQIEGAGLRPQFSSSEGNTQYTTPAVNGMIGVGVDLPALD
jgi:hypothetical protein